MNQQYVNSCKSGSTYQSYSITTECLPSAQFISEVSLYNPVFIIDETGTDRRNLVHKYGYGMRGRPEKPLFVQGECESAILYINGWTVGCQNTGTSDGETFYSFVQSPQIMPYNGVNRQSPLHCHNGQL